MASSATLSSAGRQGSGSQTQRIPHAMAPLANRLGWIHMKEQGRESTSPGLQKSQFSDNEERLFSILAFHVATIALFLNNVEDAFHDLVLDSPPAYETLPPAYSPVKDSFPPPYTTSAAQWPQPLKSAIALDLERKEGISSILPKEVLPNASVDWTRIDKIRSHGKAKDKKAAKKAQQAKWADSGDEGAGGSKNGGGDDEQNGENGSAGGAGGDGGGDDNNDGGDGDGWDDAPKKGKKGKAKNNKKKQEEEEEEERKKKEEEEAAAAAAAGATNENASTAANFWDTKSADANPDDEWASATTKKGKKGKKGNKVEPTVTEIPAAADPKFDEINLDDGTVPKLDLDFGGSNNKTSNFGSGAGGGWGTWDFTNIDDTGATKDDTNKDDADGANAWGMATSKKDKKKKNNSEFDFSFGDDASKKEESKEEDAFAGFTTLSAKDKKKNKKNTMVSSFEALDPEPTSEIPPVPNVEENDLSWATTGSKKDKKNGKKNNKVTTEPEPPQRPTPPPPPESAVVDTDDMWGAFSTVKSNKKKGKKDTVVEEQETAKLNATGTTTDFGDDTWSGFTTTKSKSKKNGTVSPEPAIGALGDGLGTNSWGDNWGLSANKKDKTSIGNDFGAFDDLAIDGKADTTEDNSWGFAGIKDKDRGKDKKKGSKGVEDITPPAAPDPPKDETEKEKEDDWSTGIWGTAANKKSKKDKKSKASEVESVVTAAIPKDSKVFGPDSVDEPSQDTTNSWETGWNFGGKKDKKANKKGSGVVELSPDATPSITAVLPDTIVDTAQPEDDTWSGWGTAKTKGKKGKKDNPLVPAPPPVPDPPDLGLTPGNSPPAEPATTVMQDMDSFALNDDWATTTTSKSKKKDAKKTNATSTAASKLTKTEEAKSETKKPAAADSFMDFFNDPITAEPAVVEEPPKPAKTSMWGSLGMSSTTTKPKTAKEREKEKKEKEKAEKEEKERAQKEKAEQEEKERKEREEQEEHERMEKEEKERLEREQKEKEEAKKAEKEAAKKAKKEAEEAAAAEKAAKKEAKKTGKTSTSKISAKKDGKAEGKSEAKAEADIHEEDDVAALLGELEGPEAASDDKPNQVDAWGFWGSKEKETEKETKKKTVGSTAKEIAAERPANGKDSPKATRDLDPDPIKASPAAKGPLKTSSNAAATGVKDKDKTKDKDKEKEAEKGKDKEKEKEKAGGSSSIAERIKALQGGASASASASAPVAADPSPKEEAKDLLDVKRPSLARKGLSSSKSVPKAKELDPAPAPATDILSNAVPGGFPIDDFTDVIDPLPAMPADKGKKASKSSAADKKSKASKLVEVPDIIDVSVPPPPPAPPVAEEPKKKSSSDARKKSSKKEEPAKLPTPPPEPELVEIAPTKKDRPRVVRDSTASSSWGFWGSGPKEPEPPKESPPAEEETPSPKKKSKAGAPALGRSKSTRKPVDQDVEKASDGSDEVKKTDSRPPKPARGMSFSSIFGAAPPPSRSKSMRQSTSSTKPSSRRRSVDVDAGLLSPPEDEDLQFRVSDKAAKTLGISKSQPSRSKSTRDKGKKRAVPDPYAIDGDEDIVMIDALNEEQLVDAPSSKRKSKSKRYVPKSEDAVLVDGAGPSSGPDVITGPDDMAFVMTPKRPSVKRAGSSAKKSEGGLLGGLFGASRKKERRPSGGEEEDAKRLRRENRRVQASRKLSDPDGPPTDATPREGVSTDVEDAEAKRAERRARRAERERLRVAEEAELEARESRRKDKERSKAREERSRQKLEDEDRRARRAAKIERMEQEEAAAAREAEDRDATERRRRRRERESVDIAGEMPTRPRASDRRRSYQPEDGYVRREERASRRKSTQVPSGERSSRRPPPVDEYLDPRDAPRGATRPYLSRNDTDKTASWVHNVNSDPPLPPPVEPTVIDGDSSPKENRERDKDRDRERDRDRDKERAERRKSSYRRDREREREREKRSDGGSGDGSAGRRRSVYDDYASPPPQRIFENLPNETKRGGAGWLKKIAGF